jgi:hypothetical protein
MNKAGNTINKKRSIHTAEIIIALLMVSAALMLLSLLFDSLHKSREIKNELKSQTTTNL